MITTRSFLSFIVSIGIAGMALSAPTKKSPAKKPPAKPGKPSKPFPPRVVKGTTQLAGDNGQFGVTYTIGSENSFNITLNSAEFSVAPIHLSEFTYAPAGNEKLLVLHYTIQNPNNRDLTYDLNSLKFTVVDADDTNHTFIELVGKEKTEKILEIGLKPAQKVDAFTAIFVPAKGAVPKLIVEHPVGGPVLRYDLRGKVKGLPAPFADPSDKSGATALEEVSAETGNFYPMKDIAFKLVSTSYSSQTLGDYELEEGKRLFIATFILKNQTTMDKSYGDNTVIPRLMQADGENVDYTGSLYKANKDEVAGGTLKPAEEVTLRAIFPIPNDVSAKTLKFQEGDSRVYTFAVK